jgi:hypothetical protein
MGVPSTFHIDVTHLPNIAVTGVGPVGPVTVAGIPDHFYISIEKLPDPLPKIQLGIDPLEVKPLSIALSVKELPSIRAHLPADFSVGLSLLGLELLCLRLCGEAQLITEPFQPNPCERCGETLRPVPLPPPSVGTVAGGNVANPAGTRRRN